MCVVVWGGCGSSKFLCYLVAWCLLPIIVFGWGCSQSGVPAFAEGFTMSRSGCSRVSVGSLFSYHRWLCRLVGSQVLWCAHRVVQSPGGCFVLWLFRVVG